LARVVGSAADPWLGCSAPDDIDDDSNDEEEEDDDDEEEEEEDDDEEEEEEEDDDEEEEEEEEDDDDDKEVDQGDGDVPRCGLAGRLVGGPRGTTNCSSPPTRAECQREISE
jgi:hypothetical protein